MLEIIVTGSGAQLGKEFQKLSHSNPEFHFTFVSRTELDISNENNVHEYLSQGNYDVLINCAAYTNVEQAEDNNSGAAQVNEKAAGILAQACKVQDMLLVHVSTDYVFDGKSGIPYTEDMEANPLNVYGQTKLAGEKEIQSKAGAHLVLRTSWLYSTFGKNFLKTIKKAAEEKDELRIVNDQVSTPTYAYCLATVILNIIRDYSADKQEFPSGVYHYSNLGTASWYDFAKEIVEQSNLKCNIVAVNSMEFVTKALRPSFSKLNCDKISKTFELEIPHWKDALRDCINNMNNE